MSGSSELMLGLAAVYHATNEMATEFVEALSKAEPATKEIVDALDDSLWQHVHTVMKFGNSSPKHLGETIYHLREANELGNLYIETHS